MINQDRLSEYSVAFWRDGFVRLHNAIAESSISTLRASIDARIAAGHCAPINASDPGFLFDEQLWRVDDGVKEIALSRTFGAVMAGLLKTPALTLLGDQVLVKEPGAISQTLWHQDRNYWALSGDQLASAWIPLDAVPASRSLRFVPGSHRGTIALPPRHFGTGKRHIDIGSAEWTALPPGSDFADEAVSVPADVGDAIVFHAALVHGAHGNQAPDQRRRAYVTRWAGDDVRFQWRSGDVAIPKGAHGLENGDRISGASFPQMTFPYR